AGNESLTRTCDGRACSDASLVHLAMRGAIEQQAAVLLDGFDQVRVAGIVGDRVADREAHAAQRRCLRHVAARLVRRGERELDRAFVHVYDDAEAEFGLGVAQVALSDDDIAQRRSWSLESRRRISM